MKNIAGSIDKINPNLLTTLQTVTANNQMQAPLNQQAISRTGTQLLSMEKHQLQTAHIAFDSTTDIAKTANAHIKDSIPVWHAMATTL